MLGVVNDGPEARDELLDDVESVEGALQAVRNIYQMISHVFIPNNLTCDASPLTGGSPNLEANHHSPFQPELSLHRLLSAKPRGRW
jgi:hypothetical protein